MNCEKCGRPVGHLINCEIIAPFLADAEEIIALRKFPSMPMAVANVASLLEMKGFPVWYRPIAERPVT